MPKQTPSVMSAEGAQCSCAVGHPAAPDLVDLNDFNDLIHPSITKFFVPAPSFSEVFSKPRRGEIVA